MKLINFGVKTSCFWYVTDFIERMCAITFNTMNLTLLDHTCCTWILPASFGQYIYFIELRIWLLHVFFVGIHPSTKLATTEFLSDPGIPGPIYGSGSL